MKLKTLTIALVAILFTGLTSYGQTVNEVVDNYFKAIGGRDKVKSIKTMKITGKFFMGPMEIPVESSVKKPNKVYSTATAQGMTHVWASMVKMLGSLVLLWAIQCHTKCLKKIHAI